MGPGVLGLAFLRAPFLRTSVLRTSILSTTAGAAAATAGDAMRISAATLAHFGRAALGLGGRNCKFTLDSGFDARLD